jgi:diacylglycerol O-acyltransferase / wax synthase
MKKKLALLDSGWLTMETPETPMHVGGLMLYKVPEGAPETFMQDMLNWLMDVKEVARPFNKKLKTNLPMNLDAGWVTDRDIDMDYHIRHAALPRPGRIRELLALVSRLHAQRMDRQHPLWECYLIEGIEGDRFGLYIKIHHSLVDGVAAMRILQSRLGMSAGDKFPPPWSAEWEEIEREKSGKVKSVKLPRPGLVESMKALSNVAVNLAKLAATPKDSNIKSIYKAPPTVLNKRVQPARRFAAQSWSLSRLKKVAKKYDATLNDVVLAMCGGALREYLLGYATLPEHSLVANVPVSIRSADQADEGGNAISAVQVTLGTRIRSAPSRLRAIQESMNSAKQRLADMSRFEIDAHTIMTNLPLLAGQVSGLDGRVPVMFNVVVSNVPGPRETRYLNGAELLANYPASLIWHGYAMNITVQSYRDSLDFGVIACRESAPKVQRILDLLENALVELEEAVVKPKAAPEEPASTDSKQAAA